MRNLTPAQVLRLQSAAQELSDAMNACNAGLRPDEDGVVFDVAVRELPLQTLTRYLTHYKVLITHRQTVTD